MQKHDLDINFNLLVGVVQCIIPCHAWEAHWHKVSMLDLECALSDVGNPGPCTSSIFASVNKNLLTNIIMLTYHSIYFIRLLLSPAICVPQVN